MTQNIIDVVGFLAGAMTVGAFYCQRMIRLRCAAIAANVMFITYGATMALIPILALHCILLPLNIYRLIDAVRTKRRQQRALHEQARPGSVNPAV